MATAASEADGARRAGVLAHVTSLPGAAPDGDLGEDSVTFLDWCADAGLRIWQVLPLGPPGPGRSPYSATSSFAGNPAWAPPPGPDDDDGDDAAWLDEWTLYAALKERHGGLPWMRWDDELRRRDAGALARARRELEPQLRRHRRVQRALERAATRLRGEAARRDIVWFGDLPFYVALDSADVWARRELFRVDAEGRPLAVAGCPPDAYAEDGQRWDQPVYDWGAMEAEGFAWWRARCARAFDWVHALRLDHFRGFAAYWEIPPDAATAREGRWVEGPGARLLDALFDAPPRGRLVAEDLGVIDDDVDALRDRYALPGMHVLQFGLDDPQSVHHPANHRARGLACTGTHDSDTFVGWFSTLDAERRAAVASELGTGDPVEVAFAALERCWSSPCEWAVAPLQDLLGLGSEARMNVPGRARDQWRWRAEHGALCPELAARLRELGARHGR